MTQTRFRSGRRRAFSMIEIMVVMLIIGLLAAIVTPNALRRIDGAKRKTARAQIYSLANAAKDFYLDTDQYPRTLQDLIQNSSMRGWDGPYLDPPIVPKDPWKSEYQYSPPSGRGSFDIWSSGNNKGEIRYSKLGTEDDE